MAKAQEPKVESFEAMEFHEGEVTFYILGTTPFICNRMSQKATQQLLLPRKKTAADKATTLKHDPLEEYRSSPYTNRDDNGPTLIQMVTSAFRKSMASAALEIPGMKKAQVARLTWVTADRVDIYGVPQMLMSVVRSADINKTPDIRTRAILPEWACTVSMRYASKQLSAKQLGNLMAAAGRLIGVGDWRNEKGAGSYGQFEIVAADDPRFLHTVKYGGRAAQLAGLEEPMAYDDETETLYSWYVSEVDRMGKNKAEVVEDGEGKKRRGRKNGVAAEATA